jgi:dipeptidase E
MKLFLASLASATMDLVQPLLSDEPSNLKLAYIATAADTYPGASWIESDKQKMSEMGFAYDVYDIKGKDVKTLRQELSTYDVIYVTGGNTFYLLYQARLSGFDIVIKELISQGIVYIGGSAGSCILCPTVKHVTILIPWQVQATDYSARLVPQLIVPAGRDKYRARHEQIKARLGDQPFSPTTKHW